MHLYLIPLAVMLAVWASLVVLDLRLGIFRAVDRFRSPAVQWIAYIWLGLFLTFVRLLVRRSSESRAAWKKGMLVLSAMTIEEAFFRGWLQKRVGLIASTLLFALAHASLGQPFLLIGVTFISLVISFVFYRTKNLIPDIIAHGIFDAIQLFVTIPIVYNMSGS